MPKFETTEEFLARGGKITKIPEGRSAHVSLRDWRFAQRKSGRVGASATAAQAASQRNAQDATRAR